MAKNKINEMLQKKDPAALRRERTPVPAVDILDAAAQGTETEQKSAQEIPDTKIESVERSKKEFVQTAEKIGEEITIGKDDEEVSPDRPNRVRKQRIYSERDIQSVLAIEKRATKRYSFEIYVDQIDDIQHICELYEEANPDKKLSASRLIREVLDSFLSDALKAFGKSDE